MTIERLLLKLRHRDTVSADEEAVLRAIASSPERIPARRCAIREGQLLNRSMLMVEGIMGRYKDMRDGQRQITEVHIAGDFADLHGFLLKRLDHDLLAMTDCTVSWVTHDALEKVTEDHAHLARMLWFSTCLDAAIHRAWAVSLGRRDAAARLGHLMCELQIRLQIVGLADENGYALPLTQADLAECLGLTPVHVNRVLKDLRERDLLTFRNGRVRIHDFDRLGRIAEFTRDYLYLDRLAI
jgi:CRP-like cAMP-binding protein